jgi:hypothetical protein
MTYRIISLHYLKLPKVEAQEHARQLTAATLEQTLVATQASEATFRVFAEKFQEFGKLLHAPPALTPPWRKCGAESLRAKEILDHFRALETLVSDVTFTNVLHQPALEVEVQKGGVKRQRS